MFSSVAAVLLCRSTLAFPIAELMVSDAQMQQLSSTTGAEAEGLAADILMPELMAFFQQAENKIAVGPGDLVISQNVPDTSIDRHCGHKIDALHGHAVGDVTNSSYLKGGTKISWDSVKVFMDAELDAGLAISGDVRVHTGVKIFHHCHSLARETVHLDLKSSGKNGVGISLTASNAHIEISDRTPFLVFNFKADVWGTVLSWNADEVSVHHGCKIKVLGVTIVSVCGYIAKKVKEQAQTLLTKVTQVDAPKLLQRLEDKINALIGSEVRIPLKVASAVTV